MKREKILTALGCLAVAIVLFGLAHRDNLSRNTQPAEQEATTPVVQETVEECVVEEPIVEPPKVEPAYTDEELEILAIIIYQEAGGSSFSDDTRLKVGNVFLNRVASSRYPNTFYEVATQRAQYGRLYWTGLMWPKRASNPYEAKAVERAYTLARRLLEGERVLPENVIYQAEFRQGKGTHCEQEGFYFCY